MSSQKPEARNYVIYVMLGIIFGISPNYSLEASCLWYIPSFYYYQCEPNCPTKYPDSDTALNVIMQDQWQYHSTHDGTCALHNGVYGKAASYEVSQKQCEYHSNGQPIRCDRVAVFYYADGAFCDSTTQSTVVWGCTPDQQQYTIKLEPSTGSPESAEILTSIEPDKITNGLVAKVYDQNGQLVPNASVRLELSVQANSGGHHHDVDRPKGILSNGTVSGDKITGNTSSNGLVFAFTAPKVAGNHKIKASCTDGKNCKPEGADTVWVGHKGLQLLGDNAVYQLIPNATKDPGHPDNHYLTLTAASRLAVFATLYHAKYPDLAVLHLNDASLERGGIFDLNHNWRSPHWEHCRGAVIDIRANGAEGALEITNPTDPMIKKFKALAIVVGADAAWEVPKKKDPSTNKLVDQWEIRHFHTKLTGQEGLQCP